MKIKSDFVTNSSSTGYIIDIREISIPTVLELFELVKDNEIIKNFVSKTTIGTTVVVLEQNIEFPIILDKLCNNILCYKEFNIIFEKCNITNNTNDIEKSNFVTYEPEDSDGCCVYWTNKENIKFSKHLINTFYKIRVERND